MTHLYPFLAKTFFITPEVSVTHTTEGERTDFITSVTFPSPAPISISKGDDAELGGGRMLCNCSCEKINIWPRPRILREKYQ